MYGLSGRLQLTEPQFAEPQFAELRFRNRRLQSVGGQKWNWLLRMRKWVLWLKTIKRSALSGFPPAFC